MSILLKSLFLILLLSLECKATENLIKEGTKETLPIMVNKGYLIIDSQLDNKTNSLIEKSIVNKLLVTLLLKKNS